MSNSIFDLLPNDIILFIFSYLVSPIQKAELEKEIQKKERIYNEASSLIQNIEKKYITYAILNHNPQASSLFFPYIIHCKNQIDSSTEIKQLKIKCKEATEGLDKAKNIMKFQNANVDDLKTASMVSKRFNRLAIFFIKDLSTQNVLLLSKDNGKLQRYILDCFSASLKTAQANLCILFLNKIINASHTIDNKPLIQHAIETGRPDFSYQMVIFLHSHGADLTFNNQSDENILVKVARENMLADKMKRCQELANRKNISFEDSRSQYIEEMEKIIKFISLEIQRNTYKTSLSKH